jgi:putative peptide zinc metalloprotease protein
MSELLYAVVRRIDGTKTVRAIASDLSIELDRPVSDDDIVFLLKRKLVGAGLIDLGAPMQPVARPDPFLGLRLRARVVPSAWVMRATRIWSFLYAPPLVLAVLTAMAGFDVWLLFVHGVAAAARETLLRPELSLIIIGLSIGSTAFHELGHATACRVGGARPGPIGVGLYVAWPVFYSDVTDSYRLNRAGRLRTDLGGVYFNVVFSAATAAAYLATGWEPLLLAIVIVQIDALHQFFPFFRLDGYYVASDLVGVPDLFMRMRPTIVSMLPGRPVHPQVAALKPWVRRAVVAWVGLTLLVIAFLYLMLVLAAPRLLGTARLSLAMHAAAIAFAVQHGQPALAALNVIQVVLLALPLVALAVTTSMMARRVARWWWRAGRRRPELRVATVAACVVALMAGAGSFSAPTQYEPIRPTDRGTIPSPQTFGHVLDPWMPSSGPIPAGPASGQASPSTGATPSAAPSAAPSQSPIPIPTMEASPIPSSSAPPSPSPTDSPSPSPSPS